MTHISATDALAQKLFGKDLCDLQPEEAKVVQGLLDNMRLSRDASVVADSKASFGDRLADRVAAVGGSWGFIIAFTVVLFGWMILNGNILKYFGLAFDPYPFIFLNLMLSTLAAIQAPIIMMSQNRQATKDRVAAALDFEINLRAELEIMRLHEKIDRAIIERLDRILAQVEKPAK